MRDIWVRRVFGVCERGNRLADELAKVVCMITMDELELFELGNAEEYVQYRTAGVGVNPVQSEGRESGR